MKIEETLFANFAQKFYAFSTKPHISLASQCNCVRAGGSLTYKSMLTHLWALPNGDPSGNRTQVSSVRGWRLSRLTKGPYGGGDYPHRLGEPVL